ncbi:hypothetical protein KA977_11130 [Candidatus Dependentiae bacterium]|nr:hypothetical protein [Candidatus Dependentiae bacterium]
MFNYKKTHCEKELFHYIESYNSNLSNLFTKFKTKEIDLKKYNFLAESLNEIYIFYTEKKYYELAVLSNSLYHKLSETIGNPINEIDYIVFEKDGTSIHKQTISNPKSVNIVLDNIRSPFNIGSIFRTAESCGKVDEIYLCGITPTPDHNRVKRSAMNTENSIKWSHIVYTEEIIKKLKSDNKSIFSVETTSKSINYKSINYSDFSNIVLVFGNEEFGINHSVLNESDYIINIQMLGKKNSLNVAVAAGIILYNLI